jgi:hypothetical protein
MKIFYENREKRHDNTNNKTQQRKKGLNWIFKQQKKVGRFDNGEEKKNSQ